MLKQSNHHFIRIPLLQKSEASNCKYTNFGQKTSKMVKYSFYPDQKKTPTDTKRKILISMKPQTHNEDYRADIDGLRAIAIIAVLLFHIDHQLLPGGYTGVDIFFVISGYLISSHVIREIIKSNNFSFRIFYMKRIKRILPALLVMIFTTIIAGHYLLTNFYFFTLGEQSLSATLSFSNILFYNESGYFDLDSEKKPLLHTWSLGVEEQFYLIWPIILIALFLKIKNIKHITLILISLLSISFASNYIFSDNPNAIFYLMPFRIFEFAAGSLIAIQHQFRPTTQKTSSIENNIFSLVAITMLISPMFFLTNKSLFPYYNALPTIIGSAILIHNKNTMASKILSAKPLVFIGLISYSLYLYHWPIIVYIKTLNQSINLRIELTYTLILSLTLLTSLVSYHLIEKPFRFSNKKHIHYLHALLFFLLILISTMISRQTIESHNDSIEIIKKTFDEISNERYSLLKKYGCNVADDKNQNNCDWEAPNQLLFIGNSHNIDGYNIFRTITKDNKKYNLMYSGSSYYCKYKINSQSVIASESGKCTSGAVNLNSIDFIKNIDTLVVNIFKIKEWGGTETKIIKKIKSINPEINIVLIGGYIGLRPNLCRELVNKFGQTDICKHEKFVSFWGKTEKNWVLKQSFAETNFLYIDRISLLCGKQRELSKCKSLVNDELIFYDGDHFSLAGSKYVSELIYKEYKTELNNMNIYVLPNNIN